MASIYKKPVLLTDPRTGRKVKTKSKKWWGRFRDEYGNEKRVPLATDRAAAQTLLAEHVKKVERKLAGLEDPFDKHHKRPLSEHAADFEKYLKNKGTTAMHVQKTAQRVHAVIDACKFKTILQISPSRVQQYLADLRADGRSIATSNHYQRAIKMFTRWLVRDRRTPEDCLAHLSRINADTDRRRVRRPLSSEEFQRLLEAAETGPTIQCISGPDRAILYIIAGYTGFRRGEIGSVTLRSFNFESEPPTLTVQAGYSKRRRTDVLPLRKDFAQRIRQWLAQRPESSPSDPLFRLGHRRTATMMARDLEAARAKWLDEAKTKQERQRREESSFLEYEDADGQFADFHALRKTFITNLSLAGVQPKAAQTLARHSDINLTMNTYTTLQVLDQAAAVESLPPVPSAVEQKAGGSSESRRDPATIDAEHAVHADRASLPPDVARILAAWETLPADVRSRLTAEVGSTTQLRLA
jgi:integrase